MKRLRFEHGKFTVWPSLATFFELKIAEGYSHTDEDADMQTYYIKVRFGVRWYMLEYIR